MAGEKPRLRKREVLLALCAGVLGAGGAALWLDDDEDDRNWDVQLDIVDSEDTEVTYDVRDFDQVSTVGPQDIVITYGEEFSVRAEGPMGALSQLEAVVSHDRLLIRPKDGDLDGSLGDLGTSTFYITMPALEWLSTEGSGEVEVDRIAGESFVGIIGGASEIQIDDIEVEDLEFRITGAGEVEMAGSANNTSIIISGAGEVHGEGLRSTDARVAISGLGEVDLTVEEEADVAVTGAGEVDIFGDATCSITQSGLASVNCESGGN